MPLARKQVASRCVSEQSQEDFAQLSRDRNPMHMDAVKARRTQAGQPVVHGVHTLLWSLAKFTRFYVQGFYDLCTALIERAGSVEKIIVLYPSTVFVEERPNGMTEYSMAKAAGEQLCVDMNGQMPALYILTSRLPRLHTDQTAGVLPEREINPVETLLPIIRSMAHLRTGPIQS